MLKKNINLEDKTIFITGVAGFIGSYLAKRILDDFDKVKVVGIDSITDYYDTRLKEERLKQFAGFGDRFLFIQDNIANKVAVENVFQKYTPSIVVNLAAQAGVRYSITNPDVYIESNIIGFYNILEACRRNW